MASKGHTKAVNDDMSIIIQPLEPRFIETLAAWHQAEWQHLDRTIDKATRCAWLQAHCDTTTLPSTFIAFENAVLVGSICLVEHDIADRPQYSPWVSRIFVTPEHRGKAIGKALLEHARETLRRQGHDALYLITENKGPYYTRLGWSKVGDYELNGFALEIMRVSLHR